MTDPGVYDLIFVALVCTGFGFLLCFVVFFRKRGT